MRFPLAFTACGDAGLFTSAPASISAFTTAAWPCKRRRAELSFISSQNLVHVLPGLQAGPDRGHVAVLCRPVQRFSDPVLLPILTKCALIFASNDRTPSALHTVVVVRLVHLRQAERIRHIELWEYLRCEHVGQLHGECLEDGNTTAPQKRHHIALVFDPSSSSARPRRGRLPRASSPVSQRLRVLSPLLSRGYSCSWSREGDLCASPACPSLQVRPRNERCGPLEPRKRMHCINDFTSHHFCQLLHLRIKYVIHDSRMTV